MKGIVGAELGSTEASGSMGVVKSSAAGRSSLPVWGMRLTASYGAVHAHIGCTGVHTRSTPQRTAKERMMR